MEIKQNFADVVDMKNHLKQFDWREDETSDKLVACAIGERGKKKFELSYTANLTKVEIALGRKYMLMPSVQIKDIETNEIFFVWDMSTIGECSIFLEWYEYTRMKANRRNFDLREVNRASALDKFFEDYERM
jgi:hypothetical protein